METTIWIESELCFNAVILGSDPELFSTLLPLRYPTEFQIMWNSFPSLSVILYRPTLFEEIIVIQNVIQIHQYLFHDRAAEAKYFFWTFKRYPQYSNQFIN